jgi:hypothetical protein
LFLFRIDTKKLNVTSDIFSAALEAEGIPNKAHLITGGMPEYQYDIFKNRSAFPHCKHPFVNSDFDTNVSYAHIECPHAERAFEQVINLEISEFYNEQDIKEMGLAVEKVARYYLLQNSTPLNSPLSLEKRGGVGG